MRSYIVTWEIEVDAETAVDAAREALRIQRDPQSIAQVFNVCPHQEESETVAMGWVEVDLIKEIAAVVGVVGTGDAKLLRVTSTMKNERK